MDAAARVFAERGYHEATMAMIARSAGFTAASLYTYFQSKDEIFEALLQDIRRGILATFDEPTPSGLSFPQRLELLLQRQIAYLAARRDAFRVAFDVHARQEKWDGHREFLDRLGRFLAAHADAALRYPAADAAVILFGLANALVAPWFRAGGPPDPAREAARLVDVFLNGAGRRAP